MDGQALQTSSREKQLKKRRNEKREARDRNRNRDRKKYIKNTKERTLNGIKFFNSLTER